jgi:hypothetical protein
VIDIRIQFVTRSYLPTWRLWFFAWSLQRHLLTAPPQLGLPNKMRYMAEVRLLGLMLGVTIAHNTRLQPPTPIVPGVPGTVNQPSN